MVVERVEQREVQDRRNRFGALVVAHGLRADAVEIGLRPAVRPGFEAHPVGAERMEFARLAVERDGLQIGVAGDQQMRDQRLDQSRLALPGVGPIEQGQQRVAVVLAFAVEKRQRHAAGGLGHHADRAVHHRIAPIALAGERRGIARGPHGAATEMERDHRAWRDGFSPDVSLEEAGQSQRHGVLFGFDGAQASRACGRPSCSQDVRRRRCCDAAMSAADRGAFSYEVRERSREGRVSGPRAR
jgi:hypothetical protein